MGESFQIEQSRRMRAVADEIGEAIASASDLHLRHRPREGEWSAIEVVGHLVDKAQFWSRRVERISREDRPLLPGYDQDVYVRRRGYQMANPAPLLDQLRSEFERFAGQVEQLPDAALDREGVHAEFGPLTARRCVEYMVDSIPDHLQQLRGALADALETSRVTLAALPGERGSKATEQDGRAVSERLRTLVDPSALAKGAVALVDELTVTWVVEAPGLEQPPTVRSDVGLRLYQTLRRLGDSNLYATAVTLPDGTVLRWSCQADGKQLGSGQVEVYRTHPESRKKPDVPTGQLIKQPRWQSNVFAGTIRDWSIYVPAQFDPASPARVMVFQDGVRFYQEHVPTVFDNLIAAGDLPVTVAIFINPGVFADTTISNRSFEYDTLSDQFSRFLLEEILPEVEKSYPLRHDPASRAICGLSSGGICAFTVAWQRPDQFGRVLSEIGSFTNIAHGLTQRDGGHNYPALIRRAPRKPIRVFLQDGENDLDNEWGNWWLANQEMASALAFAGYDYTFIRGHGFHSGRHGQAILPDALRWLWRGWQ
jgi:enterochelin esterase family protein